MSRVRGGDSPIRPSKLVQGATVEQPDAPAERAERRAAASKRILRAATMPVGDPEQICAELSELRCRHRVTEE